MIRSLLELECYLQPNCLRTRDVERQATYTLRGGTDCEISEHRKDCGNNDWDLYVIYCVLLGCVSGGELTPQLQREVEEAAAVSRLWCGVSGPDWPVTGWSVASCDK